MFQNHVSLFGRLVITFTTFIIIISIKNLFSCRPVYSFLCFLLLIVAFFRINQWMKFTVFFFFQNWIKFYSWETKPMKLLMKWFLILEDSFDLTIWQSCQLIAKVLHFIDFLSYDNFYLTPNWFKFFQWFFHIFDYNKHGVGVFKFIDRFFLFLETQCIII